MAEFDFLPVTSLNSGQDWELISGLSGGQLALKRRIDFQGNCGCRRPIAITSGWQGECCQISIRKKSVDLLPHKVWSNFYKKEKCWTFASQIHQENMESLKVIRFGTAEWLWSEGHLTGTCLNSFGIWHFDTWQVPVTIPLGLTLDFWHLTGTISNSLTLDS